jgi:hypothetical protein
LYDFLRAGILNDQFVVINAWNEWGEGMALEPNDIYGYGFLDIIKEVKAELVIGGCPSQEHVQAQTLFFNHTHVDASILFCTSHIAMA